VLGRRVLYADASEDARESAVFVLARAGFEVITAGSGEEAKAAAARATPDVVVLDPALPGEDGLGVLAALAEKARVVAASGFDALDAPSRAAGARLFLYKPFTPAELTAAVRGEAVEARARIEARRAKAAQARESLFAAELPEAAHAQLRSLASFARRYFGAQRAFVHARVEAGLRVLGESGGAPQRPDGSVHDASDHFCNDVVAAGAPLFVADSARDVAFAHHPGARLTAFYAGAPLCTGDGPALGTLCLEDRAELPFYAEDLALLAHLAQAAGELVAGGGAPLFAADGVLGARAFAALLAAELAGAERRRRAIELTLVKLRAPHAEVLEAVAHDLNAQPDVVRLAAAEPDEGVLAFLVTDLDEERTRRRAQAALAAFTWRHPIRAAGSSALTGDGRRLPAFTVMDSARAALASSERLLGGHLERFRFER
jgi:CheY-like chemotaxis protein